MLYSEKLEKYFRLVEGDAEKPYRKLVDLVPLNEKERRFWIAFLAIQALRTPSVALQIMARLKRHIKFEGWPYSTNVHELRAAYETLFANNDIFAEFYRRIIPKEWSVLSPPGNCYFLKPDNPAMVLGSLADNTWSIAYPLSPTKCFIAGPGIRNSQHGPIALPRALSRQEYETLIAQLASCAWKTAISIPHDSDGPLREILAMRLGRHTLTELANESVLPSFWGDVS